MPRESGTATILGDLAEHTIMEIRPGDGAVVKNPAFNMANATLPVRLRFYADMGDGWGYCQRGNTEWKDGGWFDMTPPWGPDNGPFEMFWSEDMQGADTGIKITAQTIGVIPEPAPIEVPWSYGWIPAATA